jgi:choline dehydrogenase
MTTTIVVGGGTAGACLAARLVEAGDEVLLIEAGPDYGPLDGGRWPVELLDPTRMPVDSHCWGFVSGAAHGLPNLDLQRARVLGGCSAHNGCAVVWGHRADYDAWLAQGLSHWSADSLLPFFQKATEKLAVVTPARAEITPLHQAVLEAAPRAGYAVLPDLTDMDITHGLAINPVNIKGRFRWNVAFAYLDPLREHPGLRIVERTNVDRVIVRDGVAVGIEAAGPEGVVRFDADRVVLAGGAYGSPVILQRSGIGDPELLAQFDIDIVQLLPGVGRNLMDHPAIALRYAGTPELLERLETFVAEGGLPREEGTTALASSSRCTEIFDLHLYPIASMKSRGNWSYSISAAVMAPRSTGFVRITDRDPGAPPLIDHAYLTDDDGYDLDAIIDGVLLARELGGQEPLRSLLGDEIDPTRAASSRERLGRLLPAINSHDYHPTSSCKMGLASDPLAVVDQTGKVHGVESLYVADASIFPVIPRANTNLPVLAAAEKLAASLSMQ